jgi:hypothetical protein
MAVFVGYGDESGKQDDPNSPSSAYGILVGTDECWDGFGCAWIAALRKSGIEYFHRKEFGKPHGPYAHINETAEKQLSIELVKAVRLFGLRAYAAAVRHSALEQFNAQNGVALDAYALALYTCFFHMCINYQFDDMTIHLDWVENRSKKICAVQNYIDSDPTLPELKGWFDGVCVNHEPQPKPGARFIKAPGYQAADFVAWEARKYVHLDPKDERNQNTLGHLIRPMEWPPLRRRESLLALNEAVKIQGAFWDVEVLENAHKERDGIWEPSN